MPYRVIILRSASKDIDDKFESIRRHLGRLTAIRWSSRISERFIELEDRPEMWPEAEEAADLGINLRERLHGRRPHVYRILYTIDGDAVHIHRVRHAAQDRLGSDEI